MKRCSLQPCANFYILQEAGQDWAATFDGSRDDHAVRFVSAQLPGGEIGDDDDFAADEGLRCIGLGDSGQDLARFVAKVDFETEQLVGFGNALGDFDLGDAELDFGEVVNGDFVAGSSGGRGGGSDDCAGGGSGGKRRRTRKLRSFFRAAGCGGRRCDGPTREELPFLCGCR